MDNDSMIKNLNSLKFGLNKDNLKVFDDMIIYIRVSNLSENDGEVILQQLLDLFLHPNNINENISDIIGTSNYKKYLDSIIKEYKPKKLTLIKEHFLPIFFYIIVFTPFYNLLGSIFIDIFIKKTDINLLYNYTIGEIVSILIFMPSVFVIFRWFSKGTFKVSSFKNSFKSFMMFYLYLILVISIQMAVNLIFKDFVSIVLFAIPGIIILILGLLINIKLIVKIIYLSKGNKTYGI